MSLYGGADPQFNINEDPASVSRLCEYPVVSVGSSSWQFRGAQIIQGQDAHIMSTLDLRQDLIDHYPKVKATLPLFVSEKAWAEDYRGRE